MSENNHGNAIGKLEWLKIIRIFAPVLWRFQDSLYFLHYDVDLQQATRARAKTKWALSPRIFCEDWPVSFVANFISRGEFSAEMGDPAIEDGMKC